MQGFGLVRRASLAISVAVFLRDMFGTLIFIALLRMTPRSPILPFFAR